MRRAILTTMLMVVAAMAGCSRSDTTDLVVGYDPSSDVIGFSDSSSSWEVSKGAVYDDNNPLREMELYGYYTSQKSWVDASGSEEVQQFMVNQSVTKEDSGDWVYTPIKYWPNNSDEKISFFAFAPCGDISYTHDATTQKPSFSYTMSQNASENDDLLIATPHYDCTREQDGGGITFQFGHALTRITIKGAIENDFTEAEYAALGETNVRYVINGITFFGIHSTADLLFDESTNAWSWSVRDAATDPTIEYTATQGKTLFAYDSDEAKLGTTAETVCLDGASIFVLPQDVSNATLQVRVRKTYDLTVTDSEGVATTISQEMIYSTSDTVKVPTPDDTGVFDVAQWISMTFTFDVGNLSQYETPMTVSSALYNWTSTTVEAEIHSNLYIYSSLSDIDMVTEGSNTYGEFMICTNYDYNLRVPHHRVELDGAITSSRGFLFCSDDFGKYTNTYEVSTTTADGKDYKIFSPTLLTGEGGAEVTYVTKDDITGDRATVTYKETDTSGNQLTSTVTQEVDIYYGSNDYAYMLNEATGLYRLLYFNPSSNNAITAFDYINDGTYHEIDLTAFESNSTVYFKIIIGDLEGNGTDYSFDFSVEKSNRKDESLYVTTAVSTDTDSAYGVNKKEEDPVYILRLSVDTDHLAQNNNTFDDIVGVEMISNGGGMITQLFAVTLSSN